MYNLLITAEDGAWERTSYSYEEARFLEYTDDEFRERFRQLDKDAVNQLCSIPALFMYEQQCGLAGWIGRITTIAKHLRMVTFKFEIDPNYPPLPWELLEEYKTELHIPHRFETNRTHWAVKNVELMEVLEPLVGKAGFQVAEPLATRPAGAVDVAIITVIQPELFAVLDALKVAPLSREKTAQGTVYFPCSLRSQLTGRDYQIVVTCIGAAGNYDSSAAAAELIAKYQPRLILLTGIAAGIRGKVRIGEVVISERVVAYEPVALVAAGDGHSSRTEQRPEIDRLSHAVNQDVVTYRPEPARLAAVFQGIRGRYPAAPVNKAEEFRANVASAIDVRTATLASGEKLLRDPAKLLAVRQEQHGKVAVGEMEAAGVVAACRRANIPWLVIRGISDFGDFLKDDQFHDFASRAAATVLVDFLAHGLAIPSGETAQPGTVPVPRYPNEEIRQMSLQIERARERKRRLQDAGGSTAQVDKEILVLRRQLREGGQLRAGDSLGDGRFLLIESIGQGGFAHIWKATDRSRPGLAIVAIKVLHTNMAGDVARRERFFRGARLMAELQHPAVVRVLEPAAITISSWSTLPVGTFAKWCSRRS
jgi:nucleoside phosphorylase